MPHPLQFVDSDGGLVDSAELQEAQYEDKAIGYILYKFRLSRYKPRLLTESQHRFGRMALSAPLFLEFFPTFPFFVTAARVPYIEKDCTVRRLFNSISTRQVVKRYEQIIEEGLVPEVFRDKPIGLLFPWPHIDHGLILHDGVLDFEAKPAVGEKPTVRLVWTLPEQKRRWMSERQGWPTPYLVIEPFEQFLSNVVWDPPAEVE